MNVDLCNNRHSSADVTRGSAGHHNHVDLNGFKIDVYLSAYFWGAWHRGTAVRCINANLSVKDKKKIICIYRAASQTLNSRKNRILDAIYRIGTNI